MSLLMTSLLDNVINPDIAVQSFKVITVLFLPICSVWTLVDDTLNHDWMI